MNRRAAAALMSFLLFAACRTTTTSSTTALPTTQIEAIRARADVTRAMQQVESDRDAIIAEWRAITEIPAPSSHEEKRADYVQAKLHEYGLTDIQRDSLGNVFGTRKGTGGGKHVVFDAHLDTVFPMETNLKTRVENGKIFAPGIGDDTKNVEALLAMIRAMNAANVETKGDVTFVFTVREETDFGGVYQFLKDHGPSIQRYVTLDGGYKGFTYGGIGIYWFRYHFLGPGGHTRSDTPPYSATLPAARAIERLAKLKLPRGCWLNVGMLGAGDVFNAKAADAWYSVDLRSNNEELLKKLEKQVDAIANEEAARVGMKMRRDVDSTEEVASLPGHRNSEMVRTTEAVWRAFGFDPPITDTASNHTSAALRAGIPAIGTGVGPCEGGHALDENCEIEPVFTGIKRNIVLAVALAE
ncbi:MAG TPA: M20/M25/M40 family metallo-hydrolase [Thermoanaerobaculia bacterium]|nr:M20/M25/M40 family metallo-hydrolase [Thermoanaerobaculia bacterium]